MVEESRKHGGLADPEFSYFTATDVVNTVKQLTAYAHHEAFDTRYVACFDGRYISLGVFSQGPRGSLTPLLKGTLLPCQGQHGNKARRALLGWLIEAQLKKKTGENHFVPRVLRQLPDRGLPHRMKGA